MSKRKTTEEFIEDARKIHGDKYDYSNVEYTNNKAKVCIICPEHGEFWQTPHDHLRGEGCIKCGRQKCILTFKKSTQEFIEQANKIHNNKYDYSKAEYKNANTKVCIICPVHGEFWQAPLKHLSGQGCVKCSNRYHYTNEEWIKKASEVHNNKYDYSKSNYIHYDAKVCIICPEHGEFWQSGGGHLSGIGCPVCAGNKKSNTEEFVKKAQKIHCDKYDYSKVEYINNQTKICIICPEHGEFWQIPHHHLRGKGCPKCNIKKLEKEIKKLLDENKINYEFRKRNFSWLKYKEPLELDFYLPDYNSAIECQGIQHFEPTDFASKGQNWATNNYMETVQRDTIKKHLCAEHNVKLLYYSNLGIDYPYEVFEDKERLLKEILNKE